MFKKEHKWFYSFVAPDNERSQMVYGNGIVSTRENGEALYRHIINLVMKDYPTCVITSISKID